MTIAIYMHQLYPGGIERVISNLYHGLRARKCDVILVLNKIGFEPALEWFGPELVLHEIRPNSILQRFSGLRAVLKSLRPDVLLAAQHFANEIACLVGSSCSVPVVVSEHTTLTRELSMCPAFSVRRLIPLVDGLLYRTADAVVAVSDGVASDFAAASGIPRGRIYTIYNPVLPMRWTPDAEAGEVHPWLAKKTTTTLVAMGRLHAAKDFPTLLRALATRACRALRLVIFGTGELRLSLEALADQLELRDRVTFAGFTAAPLAQIRAADLFVLSSRYEGLPTVLIEALAVGTPVVATDCPSGPREILAGGRFGRLTPVGDARAMSQGIAEVLASAKPEVPADWVDRFRTEHATECYLQLLARIRR